MDFQGEVSGALFLDQQFLNQAQFILKHFQNKHTEKMFKVAQPPNPTDIQMDSDS